MHELASEQAYVDGLFDRIDTEVQRANERLKQVQLRVDPQNPDADALVERETEYHGLNEKLDRLTIAQLGLVFGRIDVRDPNPENPVPDRPDLDRRYIGRMGIDAPEDHYRTLLLDWRAPMARAFYLATTANPEGVETRRHLRTKGRTVVGFDDEILSGNSAGEDRADVSGESALYKALQAARTSHMSTIVETIQREQDTIIRDTTRGVMVVEGGPGTGKTAVALHRVAYLLYTWREQLSKTGVLIIGPNTEFLDYIARVLPELGETGVVLSTIGNLYPSIHPTHIDPLITQEIKGSEEMVHILTAAVRNYQIVPEQSLPLKIESIELEVTPKIVTQARTRARRSRRPHNDARKIFRDSLLDLLAHQLAAKIGADPLGGKNLLSAGDIAQLHEELSDDLNVGLLIDDLWPPLTPQQVLEELLSDESRIAAAAAEYDDETREALYREDGQAWSPSDAALLDELAVLLGTSNPDEEREEQERIWQEQIEEAQEALDILTGSASQDLDDGFDAEILMAHDVIDAETLARRQEVKEIKSTAERARADYKWAYGHVVVDEAQELSPMEWRMVMRRCPSRWMTLVGDTAQTSSPAGVDSWTDTLQPFVHSRFKRHELTVNYRTPSEIMEFANALLPLVAPDQQPAQAIRSTGRPVETLTEADVDKLKAELLADDPSRLVAVISPENVVSIKGLEFDHVIVADPKKIVNQSPQGWQDLYVAYTRATQSLTIVGELPDLPN